MTNRIIAAQLALIATLLCRGQQSYEVSFNHDGKTVHGTFTAPVGTAKAPTIILAPGSGAIDRDGTIPLVGGNAECLYPGLVNDTLRSYLELANTLVDSGYAVLRYDKLEYSYPSSLGTITFHKLWLPVESAIGYVKTRSDVDTNRIILIGHSEGSALIPFIAKTRTDVRALISVAGASTPFDSLLAYQLVNIAQTCNGDVATAEAQAGQILDYFDIIRTNTWNGGTPTLFGAPASTWYDYVLATDPVADNYNVCDLPTLFIGMGLDINVPPAELVRFENEVTVTDDFWSMPGLVHYLTPNDDPHVPEAPADTIVYWLRQHGLAMGIEVVDPKESAFQVSPDPFTTEFSITLPVGSRIDEGPVLRDSFGRRVRGGFAKCAPGKMVYADGTALIPGVYFLTLSVSGHRVTRRVIKQ